MFRETMRVSTITPTSQYGRQNSRKDRQTPGYAGQRRAERHIAGRKRIESHGPRERMLPEQQQQQSEEEQGPPQSLPSHVVAHGRTL